MWSSSKTQLLCTIDIAFFVGRDLVAADTAGKFIAAPNQAAAPTRLSHVSFPPLLTGCTWSMVRSRRDPQYLYDSAAAAVRHSRAGTASRPTVSAGVSIVITAVAVGCLRSGLEFFGTF